MFGSVHRALRTVTSFAAISILSTGKLVMQYLLLWPELWVTHFKLHLPLLLVVVHFLEFQSNVQVPLSLALTLSSLSMGLGVVVSDTLKKWRFFSKMHHMNNKHHKK